MEGSRSSRISRLLNKLRGDRHRIKYCVDKGFSFSSSAMSESTDCGSMTFGEDDLDQSVTSTPKVSTPSNETQFKNSNIDLRYGGQCLTVEQLPEFCDQLHHLVEVIRNIQSYAQITGEYPAELERRLEVEAREVAALEAETRNAREVIARTRLQRRALRDHRLQLDEQLASLRDTEVRELESTVRLSDRKLYKSWETLKDSSDPSAFDPLLEDIRNKQSALECLVRLIEGRRVSLGRSLATPHPLPPPMPRDDESPTLMGGVRKRNDQRRTNKRRRKEAHSVPLSNEPSVHTQLPQVTLYIQGSESTAAPAARRTGSVPVTPADLPSSGSVRDILFFTTTTV